MPQYLSEIMDLEDKALVLTQYPLLLKQRLHFESAIDGNVEYLVVSTSSPRGHLGLIQSLRKLKRQRVYIALAEDSAVPMKAILSLLAFCVKAEKRYLVLPDLSCSEIKSKDTFLGILSMIIAIFFGIGNMVRSWLIAVMLANSQRVRLNSNQKAEEYAYLRTNLWLGVQAGGALTHTRGVIMAALSRGRVVYVLSPDLKGVVDQSECKFLQILPNLAYIVPRELNHFSYNRYFAKRAKSALQGFDGVVYQRTALGSLTGVLVSRYFKVPLILEYNGSEIWMAQNWGTPLLFSRIIGFIENVVLRHAHLIVTVSASLQEDLITRGICEDRIAFLPNGVNPAEFDPANFSKTDVLALRERHAISPNAVIISFVGTFGPWHGAEVLASAALQLKSRADVHSDLHFIFIGDGVRRVDVERILGKYVKSGSVTLTGLISQSDVMRYLATSDILVSPTVGNPDKSPFFGSPTKLFEYMAAERPVIASKIGQIAEICAECPSIDDLSNCEEREPGEREFAITVEPGDISQLANAIKYAAENPKWRLRAGKNARQVVIDNYTWDQHFAKIEKGIEQAIKRTRVLINALHSRSGGGVTYLINVLPRLAALETLDVHIVLHTNQLASLGAALDGIEVHAVDFKQTFWRVIAFEQFHIPIMERKIDSDVIFSPANFVPIFARNNVLLLRNALSVIFKERRPVKMIYWATLYLATALSVIRAKKVISVSKYAKHSAAGGVLSLINKPASIIPHGVNKIFSPGPFEDRNEHELLAVSDLYVQKNLHNLLTAFGLLSLKNSALTLTIAGAPIDAAYAELLKSMVAKYNIESKVHFLGTVSGEELANLYRRCALFVFPSTIETFGNPLVEAMASGAPIAASNSAVMPEVAGDVAYYFNPSNVDEMVNVITALMQDRNARRELGARAVIRAEKYSWDHNVEQLYSIFDGLNRT